MSTVTKPIMLNETGQQTNDLLRNYFEFQRALAMSGSVNVVDSLYKAQVAAATSVSQVNNLFREWWHSQWVDGQTTRNELCARWFRNVLVDERVHGVRFPLFSVSQSPRGELLDDSAGLVCSPSTASSAGRDDFAFLPQFWCLEVSMEKNADGSHTIYAVEFIDPISEVRSGTHLCQVLQKNTYTREWLDGGYHYMKMQCHPSSGYDTWPQGTGKNGIVYPYIANPKYYAGMKNGVITCGTGLPPVNWASHLDGVAAWRNRGSQYAGAAGNLLKWQNAMFWLKYAVKGNSGTIEGCSSYNHYFNAAVSESNVQRILLSVSDGQNFFAGSNCIVGTRSGDDRSTSSNYSICKNKRIKSIESVSVNGTTYLALNIDNDGALFSTVAGKTCIFTMPYWSGWNDDVQGNDGSKFSATSGKETGLIQKTEFMNGAYIILSDELRQWSKDSAGNFCFDCYTCHNQSKVTTDGSISSSYTKHPDLTLRFVSGSSSGWRYIEDIAIGKDRGIMWPSSVSTTAGSGTGAKAGFYVGLAESGVRAGWCYVIY